MRYLIILAAAGSLAACTSAKEQAVTQCAEQAKALPDMVDADKFCSCITDKIPDDASVADAEEVLTNSAQQCTNEAMQDAIATMTEGTTPAE